MKPKEFLKQKIIVIKNKETCEILEKSFIGQLSLNVFHSIHMELSEAKRFFSFYLAPPF